MTNANKDARRSLRRIVKEGTSSSVMSGLGETYMAAYALFLKATPSQIAFLAAIPSLLGSCTQLISAWVGHRTGRHKALILTGVLLQAFMWLPMIWLPYFFPQHAVALLIACIVLFHAGSNMASPMWNSLMGDVVPEEQRGRYFSRRSRLMNLANFIALAVGGLILHFAEVQGHTQVGFLTLFTLAMLARLYSVYQIYRIPEPAPATGATHGVPLLELFRGVTQSNFGRFTVFLALVNFAAGISGPFFTVYMLEDLGFSYLEFMASTAAVVVMQFFTLTTWGRWGDAFGNRLVLTVTGYLIPVLPLLWLLSTNFWWIVVFQLLSGVAWSGFHLSAGNFLYDTIPRGRRSMFVAVHSTLTSVGMFAGALVGGYLSTHVSAHAAIFGVRIEFVSALWWVFLISGLLRLVFAMIFLPRLTEVRDVPQLSPASLLYRAARVDMLAGLLFNLLPPAWRKPS